MASTTIRLLARLYEPPPVLNGDESLTRMQFVKVEQERQEIDANYDRDPDDLPRVEHALRGLAERLAKAGDPSASAAWLSVARAVRYQRGRRDDTLSALIEALYWGRGNAAAWSELIDYISALPRVPMLLAIFAHIPSENRVDALSQLLLISEGHGRFARLNTAAGERLRDGLLSMAESEGDRAVIAALTGHAGRAAEKAGDLDAAVQYWRRAVAAGSADPRVADRLSVWLVNGHEYQEATRVLQQALTANPSSATIAERLERRLARCKDPHAPASRHSRFVPPASMSVGRETLVCTECGRNFQRAITRGRKPLRCPGCANSHAASRAV
jgi:tetratricopeptide (TPR) repeat protein